MSTSTLAFAFDQPSTWNEMRAAMSDRFRDNNERVGQAYFNALVIAWPEVAELVRGTMADPFYAEDMKDPRMARFFDVVTPYFL